MNILHVLLTRMPIPPRDYGGTERVLWSAMQGQRALGHNVRILVKEKHGDEPDIYAYDKKIPLEAQVEGWADCIHFHWPYQGELNTPFICTEHSNSDCGKTYPINTVFLSSQHAKLHNAECYVHNGLLWEDYGEPNLDSPKKGHLHFLAKANWAVKNVQGAVRIARAAGKQLDVLGGKRWSIKRNPYCYLGRDLTFYGMVGGERKNALIRQSEGLVFPVLWHEPFGLAITESLYLGCPVVASPYGSLPDIINADNLGFLSDSESALANAAADITRFDRRACHEHAKQHFDHMTMARRYVDCYERVINGETLNPTAPFTEDNVKLSHSLQP